MRFERSRTRAAVLLRLALGLAAAVVFGLIQPEKAFATAVVSLVYDGTTNAAISFGASGYVAGDGSPQFIANNVSGQTDILTSPGGTFGVANPVIGNNVASTYPPAATLPPGTFLYLNQTGGTAPLSDAAFGSGAGVISGPAAGFALSDTNAAGTVSYGIETWTSTFTQTTAYGGLVGSYLSIGGSVGTAGSSVVAGLQTELFITPAGAGTTEVTLAPLILAIANLGGDTYSYVALSENNSFSGAAIDVNDATGAFTGLAIDAYSDNLAANTTIEAVSTITFYADPASIDSISPDLNLLPGLSLPGESFGSSGAVPEPSTAVLGGIALVVLSAVGWVRRRRRAS